MNQRREPPGNPVRSALGEQRGKRLALAIFQQIDSHMPEILQAFDQALQARLRVLRRAQSSQSRPSKISRKAGAVPHLGLYPGASARDQDRNVGDQSHGQQGRKHQIDAQPNG